MLILLRLASKLSISYNICMKRKKDGNDNMLKNEKMSKTKIVCTIRQASNVNKEMLTKLVKAGMNVMRLNFSHGSHDEHLNKIKLLDEINKELNTYVSNFTRYERTGN